MSGICHGAPAKYMTPGEFMDRACALRQRHAPGDAGAVKAALDLMTECLISNGYGPGMAELIKLLWAPSIGGDDVLIGDDGVVGG